MKPDEILPRIRARVGALKEGLRSPVALILAVTFLKGWLFAVAIPYGKAPDEQPHFSHVMYIKNQMRMPVHYFEYLGTRLVDDVVHPQDFPDPDAASLGLAGTYCYVHGPLYYVASAIPVRLLTKRPATAAYLSRLVSVILTTAAVYVFCLVCRALFPRDPLLALGIPLLASFLPQFTFIGAMVNNDSMVNLLAALLCLLWVRSIQEGVTYSRAARMGLLTGLWFLSKGSFPIAIVTTFCVLVLDFHRRRPPLREAAGLLGSYGLLAAAVGLPLAIRNWVLFESPSGLSDAFAFWGGGIWIFPDFMTMLFGQKLGDPVTWSAVTFKSFWGLFDWMTLPLPSWIYRVCLWLTGAAVIGVLIHIIRRRKEKETSGLIILLVFATLNAGSFAIFCYYLIWQPQGRHLFPSLLPLMAVLGVGLSTFGVVERARQAILALLVAGMVWLNLYSLFHVILPHYW